MATLRILVAKVYISSKYQAWESQSSATYLAHTPQLCKITISSPGAIKYNTWDLHPMQSCILNFTFSKPSSIQFSSLPSLLGSPLAGSDGVKHTTPFSHSGKVLFPSPPLLCHLESQQSFLFFLEVLFVFSMSPLLLGVKK